MVQDGWEGLPWLIPGVCLDLPCFYSWALCKGERLGTSAEQFCLSLAISP